MNGGEQNYYFQGMFWLELGISKEAMIAVIYWYKQWKYKRNPSSNDIFAACQGFRDTGDFLVEFRGGAFGNVEELNTTPQGIMEALNEWGARIPFVISPAAQAIASMMSIPTTEQDQQAVEAISAGQQRYGRSRTTRLRRRRR